MKRRCVIILLIACFGFNSWAQSTIVDSLLSNNIMRHYRLYIPANYIAGNARPLIIHYHGYSSNALTDQTTSNYMPIADTAGFLVAYPEGLKDGHGNQYWNAGLKGLPDTVNDIQFTSDLIDALHTTYNIDYNRVFTSGFSEGGYMSIYVACHLNNKVAAIASVSGSMDPSQYPCTPYRSVPVLQIHGTADTDIPYKGGAGDFFCVNIDTIAKFWAKNDLCNPTADSTMLPNINTTDGSTVEHFVFGAQGTAASCELYRVVGAAHLDWPGNPGTGFNEDFNASQQIWRFFSTYQLDQFAGIQNVSTPSSTTFYPNPSSDNIHIVGTPPYNVFIEDITGRMIISSNQSNIDVSTLASGIYVVCIKTDTGFSINKLLKE